MPNANQAPLKVHYPSFPHKTPKQTGKKLHGLQEPTMSRGQDKTDRVKKRARHMAAVTPPLMTKTDGTFDYCFEFKKLIFWDRFVRCTRHVNFKPDILTCLLLQYPQFTGIRDW
jgi:hypothetical protein